MDFPHANWRLICTDPTSGAWNMALDEAILDSVGQGLAPTTLRLYAWDPACLSLGHAQPVMDVNRSNLDELGWDIVRRLTGGRAILHADEITYSVIGSNFEPRLAGGVLESYNVIAVALLYALQLLDIPARIVEQTKEVQLSRVEEALFENQADFNENHKNPVCFEVPSNYEITVGGKKLIGSAQARRKEGILQHGSFPLCGDLTRIIQVLAFSDATKQEQARKRLLQRAITAERASGKRVSWEESAAAFKQAFQEKLNLELKVDRISRWEEKRAGELLRAKYSNHEWTLRM